jgi:hypothetical protein
MSITIEDVERAFQDCQFELSKRTDKVTEFRSGVTGHYVYFEKKSGLPHNIHIVTDPRLEPSRDVNKSYRHSNLTRFPTHNLNGKTNHYGYAHRLRSITDLITFLQSANLLVNRVQTESNEAAWQPRQGQAQIDRDDTVVSVAAVPVPDSELDLLRSLSPSRFENVVTDIYRRLGFRAERSGSVGDHGVDVVVYTPDGEKWIVQCKRWRGTVGEPMVRDFYGTMQHEKADRGEMITTGKYTSQAVDWAKGKPIKLFDGVELSALIKTLGLNISDVS